MATDPAAVPFDRRSLAKPTLVITFFTGLNLVATFIFQALLAAKFGVGREIDAYLTSNTLPLVIRIVVSNSLALCLIPVFVEYQTASSEPAAWRIASSVINLLGAVLFVATGTCVWLAPIIVRLIAPGFDLATSSLTTSLLRIQLWSIPFQALADLLVGVYQSRYHFTLPVVAPVIGLGLMIASVLLLEPSLGISSAAWGLVLGSLVQFLLLVPLIARSGRYCWAFEWQHPGVRKVGQMLWPLAIASTLYSSDLLVDRAIASGLPEGSIGYLGYAYRLISVLVTLLIMGISSTMFPLLGRYAAENDGAAFQEVLAKILRILFFLTIPAAVGVALLSRPAVALLLERGQFTPQDTQAVASAMLFYLGLLFSQVLISPLLRSFYALKDTRLPMVMAASRFALGLALRLLFVGPWSFRGLAIAMSLCSMGNVVLGYVFLRRKLPGFRMDFTPTFLLPLLGCALLMALVITGLRQLPWRLNGVSLPFLFVGGTGLYMMLALHWRVPEAQAVFSNFKAVMRRTG